MSLGSDLIALARSKAGQWRYTNDYPDRMYPEEYGGTDCSGFVRWCYAQFGYDVGTWTGDESYAGYEVARGHYPSEIPWDDMQPGDLILMTATYWNDYSFSHYLCHIELYCGGGTMIGHPGGYGPQEKWAQAWMQAYGCITWMVRRVFEGDDDVSAQDVWDYGLGTDATPGYKNEPAWVHLSWCHHDAAAVYADVCKKDMASVEKATGEKVNTGVGLHERLAYCEAYIKQMNKKLDKLQVGGASVDYEKLATAVADKLAKRLVS